MIVRWGLDGLGELVEPYAKPLLVTTERWRGLELPVHERFLGVRPHAEREGVEAAIGRAQETGADALVGLGGGSAIDTAKAVSAATGLPLVAVPTTYAGAEWTPYFGIRDEARRMKGGGSGANTVGIVYEPALTLDLPRDESGGTAMNALAHCVEAMYVADSADARRGAKLIDEWLPRVLEDGHDAVAARARCSRARCTPGSRCATTGSTSVTRWRRRSAGATACRTGR